MKLKYILFLILILAACTESQLELQLNITLAGAGTGTVTSTPTGIDCGESCTTTFREGQVVVLDALQSDGSVFNSWIGCDEVSGTSCTVTLTANIAVEARFEVSAFTIVTLPDTQFYSENDDLAELFETQTRWIADNARDRNIVFVSHSGDLVERGAVREQWERSDRAMDTLDGVIPYSAPPGDHDYMQTELRSSGAELYLEYFGPSRYAAYDWYGGSSVNGLNHYQLFSAGGREFLHIGLEWGAPGPASNPATALGWATSIMAEYPNTPTIVTTHSYMWDRVGDEGHAPIIEDDEGDGSSGVTIFEELIKPNPQVFMVLCGNYHRAEPGNNGEWQQISINDAGLPVYEMLANYQSYANGGDGWMRLIEFLPAGGTDGLDRISVQTYSPSLDAFRTGPRSQFFFDLDFAARFNE